MKKLRPLLFFLISKCLTGLLGTSEYIFRFFPLITGIASLFLFYRVANIYFPHIYRLLCFILFYLVITSFTILQNSNNIIPMYLPCWSCYCCIINGTLILPLSDLLFLRFLEHFWSGFLMVYFLCVLRWDF